MVEALGAETDPRRVGVPCRLVVSGAARPLAGDAQLALLRVAQESIANARKHAHGSRIEVRLEFGDDGVTLSIADDGPGFDPTAVMQRPTPSGGFGLSSMAERLRHLGGNLEVHGGLGNGPGTTIVAVVPYPAAAPAPRLQPTAAAELVKSRVVVVDDHPATRADLAALLDAQPDMAVIGRAADGEEGLRLVAALQPEVALVDLRLPKLGGVETIARLTRSRTPTRIIVVTSFAQDELVLQALRAGAQGYVLKDASGALPRAPRRERPLVRLAPFRPGRGCAGGHGVGRVDCGAGGAGAAANVMGAESP